MPAAKRHTSFASVFVFPSSTTRSWWTSEEKDLRIDVFRASRLAAAARQQNQQCGAHHPPSDGIVVQCQQEKSQHRNKDLAMKVLRARLHQREKQKQDEKLQEMHDSKEEIAWGSQIAPTCCSPTRW